MVFLLHPQRKVLPGLFGLDRNEGGRTEKWGEVGGEGMVTGEWGGLNELGQCSLNFKEGIEKGEGEGEWRFGGERKETGEEEGSS